jgi:Resolvase, N terminal domain
MLSNDLAALHLGHCPESAQPRRWTGVHPKLSCAEIRIFGKFAYLCPIKGYVDLTATPPQNCRLGYGPVRTYGQTLDSQLEQLRAAGCSSQNIDREKVTGARADRRELNRMLGKLAPGDVVTVTRIDRPARSTLIYSASSSASPTRRRNSDPWRNRGPTPAPAPGD